MAAWSFTPRYCAAKTDMPEETPKMISIMNQVHWPAMPTEERARSPRRLTISVSISAKELVSMLCVAMGSASRAVSLQKGLSPR